MFLCKDIGVCCNQLAPRIKKVGNFLFRYQDVIGKGKFSTVYAGIDRDRQQPVAIKVVNLSLIRQRHMVELFNSELELLPTLSHPNLIKHHTILKSHHNYYLVMELCRKENLEQLLRSKGKLKEKQAERIIYDIYLGLEYLATNHIVHRDLKTANIMFGQNGKAKIGDFGFATQCLTEVNDIHVGTPVYMSPEGLLNNLYGPKTDIWSFGIIVFELLHGYTPLGSCKNKDQLKVKVCEPPQIKESMSEGLRQMIEGCLETNYLHRWDVNSLSKHKYIKMLEKKFYINTTVFKPLTMPKPIQASSARKNNDSKFYQSQISENQPQVDFPSHFPSLNLPEFESVQLDYQESAALIHYCRLVDKCLVVSYNPKIGRWLISLSDMLMEETHVKQKQISKTDLQNLKRVIQGYNKQYRWKYPYVSETGKPLITQQVISVIERHLVDENKEKLEKIYSQLLNQTKKLKESLESEGNLKKYVQETNAEAFIKKIKAT